MGAGSLWHWHLRVATARGVKGRCDVVFWRSQVRRETGFSLLEATVVITAVAIVAGTAGSHIGEYLNVARTIKARGDVHALVTSVTYFLSDVGRLQGANGGPPPSLLVSDGDIPEPGGDEARPWTLPMDGRLVQDLYAHMVENTVGYRRWRGPYLEGLGADPWGARYGINVGCVAATGTDYVTIVASAGPDGVVNAAFRSKVLTARQSDDLTGIVATGKDGDAAPRGGSADRSPGAPPTNLCSDASQPRNR